MVSNFVFLWVLFMCVSIDVYMCECMCLCCFKLLLVSLFLIFLCAYLFSKDRDNGILELEEKDVKISG